MQDILTSFTVQLFNADSGAVKLIFKIHVGKADKIKGAVFFQTRLPVSDISIIIDNFPISGV